MQSSEDHAEAKDPSAVNNKKHQMKLQKRIKKGEITTKALYLECIDLGLQALPSISHLLDDSRQNSRHDLSISDLRELVFVLTGMKQHCKRFKVENRPFVRNVVVVHVTSAVEQDDALKELRPLSCHPLTVRVSSSNRRLSSLPHKLFSVSEEEAIQMSLKTPTGKSCILNSNCDRAYSTNPNALNDCGGLELYVMSQSCMSTWSYPSISNREHANDGARPNDSSRIVEAKMETTATDMVQVSNKRHKIEIGAVIAVHENENGTNKEFTSLSGLLSGSRDLIPNLNVAAIIADKLRRVLVQIGHEPPVEDYYWTTLPDYANPSTASSNQQHFEENIIFQQELWPIEKPTADIKYDVVSLDCEMCKSAYGLELTRLTVVDQSLQVILDTLVKPQNPIVDYLTEFSGIDEDKLKNVTVTYDQVRIALMRVVSANTILIGHSLDNDLKILKIYHGKCIDTSVLYPHPKGFPLRLRLKTLAQKFLHINIQSSKGGHDSVEDARAALQLALMKVAKGPNFGIIDDKHMLTNENNDHRYAWLNAGMKLSTSEDQLLAPLFIHNDANEAKSMMACYGQGISSSLVPHDKLSHEIAVDEVMKELSKYYDSVANQQRDGISFCHVCLKYNSVDHLKHIKTRINDFLCLQKFRSAVIFSSQCGEDSLKSLLRMKRACSDARATASWSNKQEELLKKCFDQYHSAQVIYWTS